MLNQDNIVDSLKKTQMFKFFQTESLAMLLEFGEVRHYANEDYIIHEAEMDANIFIIVSGSVNVTVTEEEKEVYICTIGEGEVFGEAGIFSNVKRTANVITTEDAVVLSLKRDGLLKFIKKNPTSGIQLLMIVIYSLLKKLRGVNQDLAYERKSDISQEDIDNIIKNIMEDAQKVKA